MSQPRQKANADLVAFLRDFYSVGQLQLYYDTLTDGKPLPNMGEAERALRITAIEEILGKNQPVASTDPAKPNRR